VDNESPELIERQMSQTRQSLTDKVAALEQQVVGTIQSATSAVQETVESVKSAVSDTKTTVEDTVSSVSEGVMHAFDVRHHVDEHPWLMVGGAAAAGFLTGLCVFRQSTEGLPPPSPIHPGTGEPAPRYRAPGMFDSLFVMLGDELRKLGEQAITHASHSLRAAMDQEIPKLIDKAMPSNFMGQGGTTADAGQEHRPNGHHRFTAM